MKIAIISKSNKSGGGASCVAQDLMVLLNKSGHIAHHYHAGEIVQADENVKPLYGRFHWLLKKAHALLRKIGVPGAIAFELPFLINAIKKEKYELLHFHDLSSAISPYTLKYLAKKKIIVWTLHDCSPFTGGCLYTMDCNKYQNNCFSCPKKGQWPIDSYLNLMFVDRWLKKKVHSHNNIELLSPSKWMSDIALTSNMLLRAPRVISNGVNLEIYKPLKTNKIVEIKKTMDIGKEQPVLLVIASSLTDERKGVSYALNALRGIADMNPFVVLVGTADEAIYKKLNGIDYFSTGYVVDEQKLNEYYSVSDIFLNCTLADNQPLVVLETMAAGTPTVGFKTGGISEMIVQGQTGYLVDQKNMAEMEKVLRESIAGKTYIKWGEDARKRAEEKYTNDIFLKKHLKLYNSLLKSRRTYAQA